MMYRDAFGESVEMADLIVQLGDGSWLLAEHRAGRWEAPCRPHVGGRYVGSLEYVSEPRGAVYRFARRSDAVRAAVRVHGLEAVAVA